MSVRISFAGQISMPVNGCFLCLSVHCNYVIGSQRRYDRKDNMGIVTELSLSLVR
jgi:hypothetical protein